MNNSNYPIVEILSQPIEVIENMIDKIPLYGEILELSGEVMPIIKIINFGFTEFKKAKFKGFLKEYINRINAEMIIDDKIIEKFKKYISNEKNYEYISKIVDYAVNSEAVMCSQILGYFAGEISVSKIDIGYKEICVIQTLKEINDFDLELFIELYCKKKYYMEISGKNFVSINGLKQNTERITSEIEKLRIINTVEKYTKNMIFTSLVGAYGTGLGDFRYNEISDYFYEIILGSQLIKEIIVKYQINC